MAGEITIIRLMKDKYAQLYAQLSIVARNTGYDILLNEVDDCIQDAYLLLYEQWERLEGHKNLSGWLYLTARNNLMNRMRVMKGRGGIVAESLCPDNGVADLFAAQLDEEVIRQLHEQELTHDMIDQIKDLIGPDCYRFLMDYHVNEANVKAVAEKYGTTEAGAWMRNRRLIQRIRKAIFNTTITIVVLVLMAHITLCSEGRIEYEGGEQQIHIPSELH